MIVTEIIEKQRCCDVNVTEGGDGMAECYQYDLQCPLCSQWF